MLGFAIEWAHAVNVVGWIVRPDVIPCQIDVIPAERRQPTEMLIVDGDTVPAKVADGAIEISVSQ